jgi:hypothetical protein
MNHKLLAICGFLLSTQFIFAENKQEASIFKCINSKGETFYNDKPCPLKDRETLMRSVKDPLNMGKPSVPPTFVKEVEVKKIKRPTITKAQFDNSDEKFIPDELKGPDKALQDQIEREDRARVLAGASDADERRALINDQYNNPPEGSRKPAGSSMKTQKLTEAMINTQMVKDMSSKNR